jgi:hypothetical protein
MLKKKNKKYIYMKMLTEEDCEEIGTAVGFLAIKIFKFLFEMVNEFKRLTGLFNTNKDTKQS